MAKSDATNPPRSRANAGKSGPPPRVRCQLNTIDQVKNELARLYRSAKAKTTDVGDASRLANLLSILARLIESSDLEKRIEAIEQRQADALAKQGQQPRPH